MRKFTSHLLRVFAGENKAFNKVALGNKACVFLLNNSEINELSLIQKLVESCDKKVTCVFVAPTAQQNIEYDKGDIHTFDIRWFKNKQEIERCGHGSLAATAILLDEGNNRYGKSVRLHTFFGEQLSVSLTQQKGNDLHIDSQNTRYAIDFSPVLFEEQSTYQIENSNLGDISPSIRPIVPEKNTLNIISTKSSKGYTLIELDSQEAIETYTPNIEAIKNSGDRAILLVALVDAKNSTTCSAAIFRYFAPQYGVNEDSATGSAAALIAQYFLSSKSIQKLSLYQASPNIGGTMSTLASSESVLLSGNVELVN